jgi:D-3-phosphoglycerate dehydrogenase
MGKKPILLNTARGPIVDEKALIGALNEGLISGAGIDVMETEPPDANHPLRSMENVILSPHVAFYSEQSLSELKRRVAEAVVEVLSGQWPRSVVNPEVKGKTRAFILEP